MVKYSIDIQEHCLLYFNDGAVAKYNVRREDKDELVRISERALFACGRDVAKSVRDGNENVGNVLTFLKMCGIVAIMKRFVLMYLYELRTER